MSKGGNKKSPAQDKTESSLPKDVDSFVAYASFEPSASEIREVDKLKHNLFLTRTVDIAVQIILRIAITLGAGIILWIQNKEVFSIVNHAQANGSLKDIQPILAVIIPATLTETYFIARIIVEWAFKNIDYKLAD